MVKALITGASKGIGKAIALEIASDCTDIILVARTLSLLEKTKNEILQVYSDRNIILQVADLTLPESIHKCIDSIKSIDGLDVLINCAGKAIPPTSLQEISLDVWNEIFAVNITAVFLMTKAVIPFLRVSGQASIINVASTAGMSARPGWSAYAASKASVINFSDTMAEELKPYGIRTYCIAPGRTATELRKLLVPNEDPNSIMQPEHVAQVVHFLLSDAGQYIKGQTITIRGD